MQIMEISLYRKMVSLISCMVLLITYLEEASCYHTVINKEHVTCYNIWLPEASKSYMTQKMKSYSQEQSFTAFLAVKN
jgi:hypothetical protein